MDPGSASADFWMNLAGALMPWVVSAPILVIAGVIVSRVVVSLVRRRHHGVRDALEPLARAAAVQSEAWGWKPPDPFSVVIEQGETGRDDRAPSMGRQEGRRTRQRRIRRPTTPATRRECRGRAR